MNSPFPSAAVWDAEVTKMIKAFGAPIEDVDAAAIMDYLTQNHSNLRARAPSANWPRRGPLARQARRPYVPALTHLTQARPLAPADNQALRRICAR
jgi:hypothetical protein